MTPTSDERARRAWWRYVVVFVLVAGAFCAMLWPIWKSYWFQNHDMHAYPMRVIEYVRGWRGGFFTPRWAPDLYGGYGSPLFNYYAPGLTMVAGAFNLLKIDPALSLKIALVLFTAVGGVGVYGLVYGETRRADASVLAVVVWLMMPYRWVTMIYVRGDLSEYAGFCLVPGVVAAIRGIVHAQPKDLARHAVVGAFLNAAVVCTHTLTGLWLAELLPLTFVASAWRAFRDRDRDRLLAFAVAYFGGMGLASFYAIPALAERPMVHIERMTTRIRPTVESLQSLTWFIHPSFYYIGLPILIAGAVGPFIAHWKRRTASVGPLQVGSIVWLLLMLLLNPIARPVWPYFPYYELMQFPWRLLGYIAIIGAWLFAFCFNYLVPKRWFSWLVVAALSAGATYDAYQEFPRFYPMTEKEVPSTPHDISRGIYSTVVCDEYVPKQVPHVIRSPRSVYAVVEKNAELLSAVQTANGYRIEVATGGNGSLEVVNYWYPGWRVRTVTGPAPAVLSPNDWGTMRLTLPKQGTYYLDVYFGHTPWRWAGIALTWIAALGIAWIASMLLRNAKKAS